MFFVTTRRRAALALAAGIAVGGVSWPAAAQAEPRPVVFDARNGEITIGEVVELTTGRSAEVVGSVGARSDRAPTQREAMALLNGEDAPGFTDVRRVSSPAPGLSLNDIGPGAAAKNGSRETYVFRLNFFNIIVITCTEYEGEDYTLTVCEVTTPF
jgi:hypothetical protein